MAGPETPVRIPDRAAAEAFVTDLLATMDALGAVLDREGEGVRAGRLRTALAGAEAKAGLAAAYLNGLEAAKANAIALARLAPAGLARLKAAHARFAGQVEANQRVLATARTVCEGLVRQLAAETARSSVPTVYGRPATSPSPYGRGGHAPLVLSRNL